MADQGLPLNGIELNYRVTVGQEPDKMSSTELEKIEPTATQLIKRKKYSPRPGTACPSCGGNLRTCFSTLNEGGLRAINNHGACPKCQKVYRLALLEVEAVKKEVK